ncbi:DUF2892 domain-containing protein [Ferrovum sp. PN-J185]|uniref:YgaP family membrane protein n=1 Tax=Ferrovum sp. PN-J185 TaxID=1356306 RepID=UPI0007924F71|nr:DUF2892 domain-containing protein [Ferrovum sp. PN-J185]KXW56883.1 hypothetical protein FV185_08460 [Ferrovum sp. PN-J185]MCC6069249.1 DUF2892 domain-containing protein [Ferrovum sp. PN-J185]MDE1891449.1 DUF2892 domain-containing protein [Betaproteobacteria bacterium]MDE2056025.1 DUF2892 domain-containing protein [Betaproteobacteria bacterium]
MFSTNVGTLDRVARVIIGAVLLAASATGKIGIWGWLGLPVMLTGLLGWCGLYSLIGIRTCPLNKE